MLEIYPFILETIVLIRPLTERVSSSDSDLGRQLRRAQSSIALNVAEGAYSRGRNQQSRFHSAMGPARETLACLELAAALGAIPALDQGLQARFNRIIGTLCRLAVK
ncbi:MAG: four helix bundle protein [Myxococcales bacterium]|nr:four helix bundle protein [Myxococcales bacterium]MCB9610634.1 four helix bundle protein [Polyangiaceae bacterium]